MNQKFSVGSLVQLRGGYDVLAIKRHFDQSQDDPQPYYIAKSLLLGTELVYPQSALQAISVPSDNRGRIEMLWSLLLPRNRFSLDDERAMFVFVDDDLGMRLRALKDISPEIIKSELRKSMVKWGLDPKDGSRLTTEQMREVFWTSSRHKSEKKGERLVLALRAGGTWLVPLSDISENEMRYALGMHAPA